MDRLRVVVVADGELDGGSLAAALHAPVGWSVTLIAADGGALRAEALGVLPDLVMGDGDSLGERELERLRGLGIPIHLAPADKDESDTQLCLREACERGAGQIRLVGALGGARVDHALANLLLLAHPMLDGLDVALLHAGSSLRRIGTAEGPGALEISGAPGDQLSLLPLGGRVEGVTTEQLRYPLRDEPLDVGPARGLSNVLLGSNARVTTRRGCLMVIQTIAATDHRGGTT